MSEKVGTLLACFRSESFSFKHRPGVPPSFRWKLCFLKKANLKFAKSDFQTLIRQNEGSFWFCTAWLECKQTFTNFSHIFPIKIISLIKPKLDGTSSISNLPCNLGWNGWNTKSFYLIVPDLWYVDDSALFFAIHHQFFEAEVCLGDHVIYRLSAPIRR